MTQPWKWTTATCKNTDEFHKCWVLETRSNRLQTIQFHIFQNFGTNTGWAKLTYGIKSQILITFGQNSSGEKKKHRSGASGMLLIFYLWPRRQFHFGKINLTTQLWFVCFSTLTLYLNKILLTGKKNLGKYYWCRHVERWALCIVDGSISCKHLWKAIWSYLYTMKCHIYLLNQQFYL